MSQLAAVVQLLLPPSPVQVWVAGASRASSASTRGVTRALRPVREVFFGACRRNQLDAMGELLREGMGPTGGARPPCAQRGRHPLHRENSVWNGPRSDDPGAPGAQAERRGEAGPVRLLLGGAGPPAATSHSRVGGYFRPGGGLAAMSSGLA